MQTITINVPDGYEVQIVKKEEKKEPVIRTYQDLIKIGKIIKGHYITAKGGIHYITSSTKYGTEGIALSEKVAKSMLAMAMISQLMPYYGGEITKEEWKNDNKYKYIITFYKERIITVDWIDNNYYFLAFHTKEQRDEFLKYNEQLVKDYLMID